MNVIIWGNHSGTQFPDARHASVVLNGVIQPLTGALSDDAWIKSDFITVSGFHLTNLFNFMKDCHVTHGFFQPNN